jgi:hypothetical protein
MNEFLFAEWISGWVGRNPRRACRFAGPVMYFWLAQPALCFRVGWARLCFWLAGRGAHERCCTGDLESAVGLAAAEFSSAACGVFHRSRQGGA